MRFETFLLSTDDPVARRPIADDLDCMNAWNAAMFPTEDIPRAIEAQGLRREAPFDDLLP